MKTTLLSLVFCLVSFGIFSQVPQGFNYQAIARDGSGNPIINATINVRLSILSDTSGFYATGSGTYLWEETHSNIKTNAFGLITIVLGSPTAARFQGSALTFSAINWSAQPLYIGTKIAYPTTGAYKNLGSAKLWTVPYAMISAKADSAKALLKGNKLAVVSGNDLATDALFEVKRKDGQTVFAVYPDAVNIYVPRTSKGTKGGFAIGGFEGAKLGPQDYFRVTPDSIRAYINNAPPAVKGSTKGGFAIGGFDGAKGVLPNFFLNLTGANAVNTVDSAAQILWYPNKQAFLAGKVSIASADSVGTNSTALGYKSRAIGNYSQAFGYKTTARGDVSTAIGKNAVAGARSGSVSTASNAFAFGNGAIARGSDSYALGSGAIASGFMSFAFGSVGVDSTGATTSTPTKASGSYSTAIGMGAQAQNFGTMALGVGAIAYGNSSATLGYYSNASGNYSLALGYKANTSAAGYYATAIGYYSSAINYYANAFGFFASAKGYGALSLGYRSTAAGDYSVAIGTLAQTGTTATYAGAFGRSALANGANSIAVGYGATTGSSATDASAFGRLANATGATSMALGYSADATNTYSVALGYNTQSTGNTSLAMGYQSNASNSYATAIGYQAIASATNSFSFGYYSEAAGDNSFAIGTYGLNGDGTVNTGRPTKTWQPYTVAMGMGAQSSLKGDMAFGVNATASGGYSTAIGYNPTSSGQFSSAIGYSATSGGQYSTAIGYGSTSPGTYSTAMGYSAQANGNRSISIGAYYDFQSFRFNCYYNTILHRFLCTMIPIHITKYNIATDDYSIAFGNGNTSSKGGLALGSNNTAAAKGAVALGLSNTADSTYSFAAGFNSMATGHSAVSLGESLNSQSLNCVTVGSYNIAEGDNFNWVGTDPIFVVGNGTSSGGNSNALKVLKNGTLVLPLIGSVAASYYLGVDANGNVGQVTSSIRYKTDVNPVTDVSWLYNLNPVDFVYKSDPTKAIHSGLIAEEVEKVNKQFVIYKNGVVDGVSYPSLFAPMIKAIQDQKKTIESLKSENELLKERLERLESIVSSLPQGQK